MKKDIIYTFGTRVLGIFLSFLSSVFLTRLLGVEGKGEMAIFIASLDLFSMVLSLSLQPAVIFYGAKKELNYTNFFNSIIVFYSIIGLLFFILIHYVHQSVDTSIFLHRNNSTLFFEVLLAGSLVLTLIKNQLKAIFSSLKKFAILNVLQLLWIISGIVIYGFLFFTDGIWIEYPIKFVFLAYFLIVVITLVYLLVLFWKRNPNPFEFKFLQKKKSIYYFHLQALHT